MKLTVKHWAGLLTAVFLLLLGPYFFKFHYGLSGDSQDWANFGTYIGGTLGPIGAFLAFWGLMQQNKMYRDNAIVERLQPKINALEEDINALTSMIYKPLQRPGDNGASLKEAIFSGRSLDAYILKKESAGTHKLKVEVGHNLNNSQSSATTYGAYPTINTLAGKIIQLRFLLKRINLHEPSKFEIAYLSLQYKQLLLELNNKGWIEFKRFEDKFNKVVCYPSIS